MPTGFTTAQIAAILNRDGHTCPMCYRQATTANHRAGRGAGGSRAANVLSNGCAICWECNGRIESDPEFAELARTRGVKCDRLSITPPAQVEYLHPFYRMPVLLDDDGGFEFAG